MNIDHLVLTVADIARACEFYTEMGFRLSEYIAVDNTDDLVFVFFTRIDPDTHKNALYKANTNTGEVRKLIDLPARLGIVSVNADETLGAGTYNEADVPGGDPNAP